MPLIVAQRRFQPGQCQLIDAYGAHQRVSGDLADEFALAQDDARLGSAEQLIARKADNISARGNAFLGGGFVRQAKLSRFKKTAAAQVRHRQQSSAVRQFCQRRERDRFGEAAYQKIAGMDIEQHGRFCSDGCLVVAQARAVGGAHFDEARAALAQHIRNAKAAANLYQLPTRDDDLAPCCQRAEDDEHRRRVVVGHQRIFCPGQFSQQSAHMGMARAAFAGFKIVFKICVALGDLDDGLKAFLAERRSPQIGIDDDAGGVEYRAQAGALLLLEKLIDLGGDGFQRWAGLAGANLLTVDAKRLTRALHQQRACAGGSDGGQQRVAQHFVNRGKLTQLALHLG